MNAKSALLAVMLLSGILSCGAAYSEDVMVVAPTSEAAEGLDLQAVAELFKDAKNLEEFEKTLNDPETGVNNLDLDDDGKVDFIRVMEEVSDDVHVIVLQVPLGRNDYQDVATIEIERSGDKDYNMQVRGDEIIYGPDYYVAPVQVHIYAWPVMPWLYRPAYHPYRSVFYFGFYPEWWRPWRHVTINVYHTRTVRYTSRASFRVTHTTHVTHVSRVNYRASSSTRVKRQTHTVSGKRGTTKVKARKKTVKRTRKPGS